MPRLISSKGDVRVSFQDRKQNKETAKEIEKADDEYLKRIWEHSSLMPIEGKLEGSQMF